MIMAQNTHLTEMTVLPASWLYHLADLAGSMICLKAWQDLVLGVLQNSWICKGTVQEADQRKTCDCQATSQLERTQSCHAGAMESSHSQNKDQHQNGAVPVRSDVKLFPSQLAHPDPAQPVGSPCGWCPCPGCRCPALIGFPQHAAAVHIKVAVGRVILGLGIHRHPPSLEPTAKLGEKQIRCTHHYCHYSSMESPGNL